MKQLTAPNVLSAQAPKFSVSLFIIILFSLINVHLNLFRTLDFTSGTTKDYVYDTLGVTHGYTLELRNTDDGFITPTTLIAPVATEAWNGIKAMANAIA